MSLDFQRLKEIPIEKKLAVYGFLRESYADIPNPVTHICLLFYVRLSIFGKCSNVLRRSGEIKHVRIVIEGNTLKTSVYVLTTKHCKK